MRKFAPVLLRFTLLLLSIGALTLVGCLERSALEGEPPLTLQAPPLPTLLASPTPPEPTTSALLTNPIIVSATATSIIPPAPTSTPADSSTSITNSIPVSGTAETLSIPPTRTQSPSEILSATLQALTALNNPATTSITGTVPTATPVTTTLATPTEISSTVSVAATPTILTSTVATPTPIASSVITPTEVAATLATPTAVTTSSTTISPTVVPTEEPLPTVPTGTPLPTVPTATPIPITTITPWPDKSNLYVVQEGETLESIGTGWGVPTIDLATANALPITAVLTPGQPIVIPLDKIVIPTPTLFFITETPTPSTTITSTITSTETTTDTADTPPPTIDATGTDVPETHSAPPNSPYDPNNFFVHTVEAGETIYRIALRYGFTEEELINYNQLEYNNLSDNYLIYPGDDLKIPLRE